MAACSCAAEDPGPRPVRDSAGDISRSASARVRPKGATLLFTTPKEVPIGARLPTSYLRSVVKIAR